MVLSDLDSDVKVGVLVLIFLWFPTFWLPLATVDAIEEGIGKDLHSLFVTSKFGHLVRQHNMFQDDDEIFQTFCWYNVYIILFSLYWELLHKISTSMWDHVLPMTRHANESITFHNHFKHELPTTILPIIVEILVTYMFGLKVFLWFPDDGTRVDMFIDLPVMEWMGILFILFVMGTVYGIYCCFHLMFWGVGSFIQCISLFMYNRTSRIGFQITYYIVLDVLLSQCRCCCSDNTNNKEEEILFCILQLTLRLIPSILKTKDCNGQLPLHRVLFLAYYNSAGETVVTAISVKAIEEMIHIYPNSLIRSDEDWNVPIHIACHCVIQCGYIYFQNDNNHGSNNHHYLTTHYHNAVKVLGALVKARPASLTRNRVDYHDQTTTAFDFLLRAGIHNDVIEYLLCQAIKGHNSTWTNFQRLLTSVINNDNMINIYRHCRYYPINDDERMQQNHHPSSSLLMCAIEALINEKDNHFEIYYNAVMTIDYLQTAFPYQHNNNNQDDIHDVFLRAAIALANGSSNRHRYRATAITRDIIAATSTNILYQFLQWNPDIIKQE